MQPLTSSYIYFCDFKSLHFMDALKDLDAPEAARDLGWDSFTLDVQTHALHVTV